MTYLKQSRIGIATAALVWGLFSLQTANSAVITTDLTTQVSIPGVSQFQTDGADMVGMSVTVFFAGGSETIQWAATGAMSGAAAGTGWTISESGDTFADNAWSVDFGTLSVTSIVLDGTPGLTLFDRTLPNPGTVGSANGKDWVSSLLNDADIGVEYSNVVGIGAAPPINDLFQILTVSFVDFEQGSVSGQFTFSQDTDNDSRIQIPEPAMLPLFGLGLAGIAIIARKRTA
jgi:hypothetical protein